MDFAKVCTFSNFHFHFVTFPAEGNCDPTGTQKRDTDGTCICNPEFSGARCAICAEGYTGDDCKECAVHYSMDDNGLCLGKYFL